jgi:hypothetical protein
MRRWQFTGLVLGAAALFFAPQPAQAQVWVGRPAPVVVAPRPVVVASPPVVVGPSWGVGPAWGVEPAWGVGPAWGQRRYNRALRRGGWYGAVPGPRGGFVAAGRRW